ncbi:MAG: glycosyltransferase family 2 protein [Anaerolineaceae bacterium]|nr:glycosyltransferase family 2 protein [Anaerolineaceae bacterium]
MKVVNRILSALHGFSRRWASLNFILRQEGPAGLHRRINAKWFAKSDYLTWRRAREQSGVRCGVAGEFSAFEFAILLPVSGPAAALQATFDTVQNQDYPHTRVYLVKDPNGPAPEWPDLSADDLTWISANDPLPPADGYCFLFAGDRLDPCALKQVAQTAALHPGAAFIYTDEDRVDHLDRHHSPRFKPDWSPDFFLASNYTGCAVFFLQATLMKAEITHLPEPGRQGLFDLCLYLLDTNAPPAHIADVLYSVPEDTVFFQTGDETRASLQRMFGRREAAVEVISVPGEEGLYDIRRPLKCSPLISLLICTRDKPDFLARCLGSIFSRSSYSNFEVVLIDNGSRRKETLDLVESWRNREPERFQCVRVEQEFNFSVLNNLASEQANGELLVLLNNDTEVVTTNWLEQMAAEALRPEAGCVGNLLLYPNGRIQHAGIVCGVQAMATHAYKDEQKTAKGYLNQLLVKHNVLAVTAACLMVQKELYQRLGGLDEAFAVAGGDIDFCVRAYRAGKFNLVLPQVRLYHYESATRGFEDSPEKLLRMQKEYELLKMRWPDLMARDPFYNPQLDKMGRHRIGQEYAAP